MTEEEKKMKKAITSILCMCPESKNLKKLLNLIKKQNTEIDNNVIQNIREEFLKYNWENITKEQIYYQLRRIFEKGGLI